MPAKLRPPVRVWTDDERHARVQPVVDVWIRRLALTEWIVTYQFVNKPVRTTGPGVFASITYNDPYRRAVIEYVRPSLDIATDEEVEISTLHELVHLSLFPVTQRVQDLLGTESWLASELSQAIETSCENVTLRLLTLQREEFPRSFFDPFDSKGRLA